jgi:amino acid adenylation domain-containing protein
VIAMSEVLHALLQDAADRRPHSVAAVDGDRQITYEELEVAANRVAHQLADLNVRRGDRVGLCLEKSAESLISLYGVLKIGAAYVPLAGEWPAERLAHIVRNAGIRVLLGGAERARQWPALTGADSPVEHVVCVNGRADEVDPLSASPRGVTVLGTGELAKQPDRRPAVTVEADDIAYVLYTSGSTGVPKGVMLTHRNAMSFVDWAVAEFGLTHEDRLTNHAPLHFDLAVFDFFAAARVAATVVLVPKDASAFPAEMAKFVRASKISVWYSVPSALNMLAARSGVTADDAPGLRLVLFAGEVFPMDQLRNAMAVFPAARFCNLYGPTETNACNFYWVPGPIAEDETSIPVGLPLDGDELICLTDEGRVAGTNERGILWVHGPGVMRGYLGDPERTARVLRAPDPARPDLVAYCTGDIVFRDESGLWHFVGRSDSQIKSRGYRIELGEIEAALNGHPSIAECAVIPVPDEMFGNRIQAYVVAADGLSAADLTAYSRKTLPSYMTPWSFGFLAALPRTSTGKIDYQALKALQKERESERHS